MRRALRWGIPPLVVLVLLGSGFAWLYHRSLQPVAAPYPTVVPDASPQALARGGQIFKNVCIACHRSVDAVRVSGKQLEDLPPFFGSLSAPNLTSHRTAGIGAMPDATLARVIRYGVMADGRVSIMPSFALSDGDLAAVMGFIRSGDPLLAPDPSGPPPSRVSVAGRIVFFLTHGYGTAPDLPPSGLTAPPVGPTAEYGKYLAYAAYGCAECHTRGVSAGKNFGPEAFAGGFEFQGVDGKPIHSANLTLDGTGLYLWTYADFARALGQGLRPDGAIVRPPMPRYALPEVEVHALWAFLQSLPRRVSNSEDQPRVDFRHRLPEPGHERDALVFAKEAAAVPLRGDQLFVQLGCVVCHAEGALYRKQFLRARTRTPDYLVQWIRHPELVKPGTVMPSFAARLTEAQARVLVRWILATPPDQLPRLGR